MSKRASQAAKTSDSDPTGAAHRRTAQTPCSVVREALRKHRTPNTSKPRNSYTPTTGCTPRCGQSWRPDSWVSTTGYRQHHRHHRPHTAGGRRRDGTDRRRITTTDERRASPCASCPPPSTTARHFAYAKPTSSREIDSAIASSTQVQTGCTFADVTASKPLTR